MMPHPNGDIYVTDGYRNARVHRFTGDGKLVNVVGHAGQAAGPVPPAAQHRLSTTAARSMSPTAANKRIQISRRTASILGEWTGMGGPNDISRGKDGNFYIAEQEDAGNPAYVTVRDGQGKVLAQNGEPPRPRHRRRFPRRHLRRADPGPQRRQVRPGALTAASARRATPARPTEPAIRSRLPGPDAIRGQAPGRQYAIQGWAVSDGVC